MPTDNQLLNEPSIAILYGDALFQIEPPQKKTIAPTPASPSPLIETAASHTATPTKAVLIILRDHLQQGSTTHTMFLNLLKACQLSENNITLIAPYTLDLTASTIVKTYAPKQIIMFGVASSEIGLSVYFPDFQVQDVDGVTYLTAPDLSIIEHNKEAKSTLWKSLQKAFSL